MSSEVELPAESSDTPPTTTWQAIFAPQYNTYYFYNPVTQETTWTNPLQQPQPESSLQQDGLEQPEGSIDPPSPSHEIYLTYDLVTEEESSTNPVQQPQPQSSSSALQQAAEAQGIDPLLAHLDPSILAPSVPGSSGGGVSFTARFNSRTGQFTPATARQPGHLSEHERAKRMSEFYFDVGKWEDDLARRGGRLMAEEGDPGGEEETREKKRKRPSKKDLVRVSSCALLFFPHLC